jgi:hypothetical protein
MTDINKLRRDEDAKGVLQMTDEQKEILDLKAKIDEATQDALCMIYSHLENNFPEEQRWLAKQRIINSLFFLSYHPVIRFVTEQTEKPGTTPTPKIEETVI